MKTLKADKSEIVIRVKELTPDRSRRWGKMSAHQMVCHLSDSYLLSMGDRKAADKSNFFTRSIMKTGALRFPMRWPPGVPTVPELDQEAGAGTPPGVFESDRAQVLEVIDRFAATKSFAPHPMFATMSEWEWMRWGYLHADHHLRQFGL